MSNTQLLPAPALFPSSFEQRRNLLHWLMVFSLLLSTVSPIFSNITVPIFSLGADRGAWTAVALAAGDLQAQTAPYLPGRASGVIPPAMDPAAEPVVWPVAWALPQGLTDSRLAAPLAVGESLLPGWLGTLADQTNSLPEPLPVVALLDGAALGQTLTPTWLDALNLPGIDSLPGVAHPDAPVVIDEKPGGELTWQPASLALPNWLLLSGVAPLVTSRSGDALPPLAPLNGGAVCTPAASLAMTLTKPAYVISRGNEWGDVYTVTVTNNGVITTEEISLAVDPNAGFYYLGGSATVDSSVDGALSYTDPGTTAPSATAAITLTGDFTQTSLAPGETLTFTFKLATDANALSAQRLQVYLQSGSPSPLNCDTDFDNIQTARGNLLLTSYTPSIQSAAFGDQVSWTVVLENSGLGNIYLPVVDVTLGPGLINPDLSQLPSLSNPITLPVGAYVSYVFTATVGACTGLNNSIDAWWNIGNSVATIDGQATQADPLTGDASVNFLYDYPAINLAVSPMATDVPYCTDLGVEPIQVIATNSGGAAANFKLNFTNGTGATVSNVSPDWTYAAGLFTYVGGSPVGTVLGGGSATLTFDLTGANACMATSSTAFSFASSFQEACGISLTGPTKGGAITYAQDEPSIGLLKTGPVQATVGQTIVIDIDLTVSHIDNLTGNIVVTDLMPSLFQINAITVPVGTVLQDGQLITWTVPATGSGNANWVMQMSVTLNEAVCNAYAIVGNIAHARATGCATCGDVYTTDSNVYRVYVQDFDGISGFSKINTGDYEVCGSTGYTITNNYTLQRAITWPGTIFTETLGAEELAGVMIYEPGTVQVFIGGVDRTADVAIPSTAPLAIDMSAVQADLAIAKSSEIVTATAGDTITYTLSVTNTGQGNAASVTVTDTLPAGLTYGGASASQGTCDTSVVCDLGALGPGASATIIVTATVDAGRTADVVSVAYVAWDAQGLDGLQINNQSALRTVITQTTTFTATDLSISQAVTPAIVYAGAPITYTVVVTNNGPYTATDVTLVDGLPMSFTVDSATASQGACSFSGITGVCDLGQLSIGATATVTIVVTTGAAFGSEVVNFAAISAANEDLDLSDNASTAPSQVLTGTELQIAYRVIPQEASLGGNVDRSFFDWSALTLGGSSAVGACTGNSTYYQGAFTNILRGDLNLELVTSQPDACVSEQVVISVTGGTVTELTDNLFVTMTLGAGDVYTVAGYGGFFSTIPAPTVISTSNVITWSWPATTDITGTGYIYVDVQRPCSESADLSALIGYQDRCDASFTPAHSTGFAPALPDLFVQMSTPSTVLTRTQTSYQIRVGNNGDATAFNVVITDAIGSSLTFTNSTVSGATGVVTTTGVGDGNDVRWTLPSLAPGQSVLINVSAEVSGCGDLHTAVTTLNSCMDGTCGGASGSLTFTPAPATLLTSNQQVAKLPLCEQGPVRVVVKNTSAQATEYNFVITETLGYMTYVPNSAAITVTNRANAVIYTTTEYEPVSSTNGITQTLIWRFDDVDGDAAAMFLQQDARNTVTIDFRVQTTCATSNNAKALAAVEVQDLCGAPLTAQESSATTLQVLEPSMIVTKTVANASAGGGYLDGVFAGVGDTIVWRIDVANDGEQKITNLFLIDQMPDQFPVSALSPMTSSQIGSPPKLLWDEVGREVAVGETLSYLITTTVGANACNINSTNVATATYGCGTGDICGATGITATVNIDTKPAFVLNVPDVTLDQCGGGPLAIDFANSGARALDVVLTYTLPAGLAYAGLAPGTTPIPSHEPALGATGTITWGFGIIETQTPTNTLHFSVTNASGICTLSDVLPDNFADIGYTDTCGDPFDDVTQVGNTINIQRSNISTASQTPVQRRVENGGTYTWTVTVPNTGDSPTNNLLVTETLGVGWENITSTLGTPASTAFTVTENSGGGGIIEWNIGALAASGTWTVQFWADVRDEAADYRVTLDLTTNCADGGCAQASQTINHSTAFQDEAKTISQTPVSVGELFSYTISVDFYGTITYTNVVLTDTLPKLAGSLVFSITDITIQNENSGINTWGYTGLGTDKIIFSPSAPAAGKIEGPEWVTITLTGVISDSTAANNDDSFTNRFDLTYTDDTRPYAYTESVDGVVREPVLTLDKWATPLVDIEAGDIVTYNVTAQHTGVSTATAYDVVITDLIPSDLSLITSTIQTTPAASSVVSDAQHITVTYDVLTNPGSVTVIYETVADVTVEPDSILTNMARVIWTSTADDPAGEERTGGGIGPDDYFTSSQESVSTDTPSFAKFLTSPGTEYAVGDLITYTARFTTPLGTTRNIIFTDTLPNGLKYIAGTTDISGPSAFADTDDPAINGVNPSTGSAQLIWGPFTVTNPIVSPQTTLVTFTVAVANVAANQDGQNRDNDMVVSWVNDLDEPYTLSDPDGAGDYDTISVVEPVLGITKTVAPATNIVAGQNVTYTLLVEHQSDSTSDAFGLMITDIIPSDLTLVDGSVETSPAASAIVTDAQRITVTYDLLANPGSVIITYETIADQSVQPNSILPNTAKMAWTSTANDPALEERTGTGGINNYNDDASASISTGEPTFAKYLISPGTEYAVGDLITYTAYFTKPQGTIRDIVFTDTLPIGLKYVAGTTEITGPGLAKTADPTLNGANPSTGSTELIWGPFTVTNPIGNPQPVVVTFTVSVADVAANQDGQTRDNDMVVSWVNDMDAPFALADPDDPADEDTITIIEPVLAIAKSAAPVSDLVLGDEITYTLEVNHTGLSTADAYGVILTDSVPAGLILKPGSVEVRPTPTSLITTDRGITVTFDSFTQVTSTFVVTYVLLLDDDSQPASRYTNTVDLTWTSTAHDPDLEERTGAGGVDDYYDSASTHVDVADLSISKFLEDDRDYTIGEAITYSLNVTVPTGIVRAFSISDFADLGLVYEPVTSFISITAPFTLPTYAISVPGSGGADFTLAFDDTVTNTTGVAGVISVTVRLIVTNTVDTNHGETKDNSARIDYVDVDGNPEIKTSNTVQADLVEPLLVIEKSVGPTSAVPGDTVFYDILIYHAATSTVPAYNVAVTDVVPTDIDYISNSWDQIAGVAADLGSMSDSGLPTLPAFWSMIPASVTQANPIELRFNGVISTSLAFGVAITNQITTTWTSLLTDPYGQRRDGSGGVDDYATSAEAAVALSEVAIDKSGPLTVTAGTVITYLLTVRNSGPYTAVNAIITDTMPFQILAGSIIATFVVPATGSGVCVITDDPSGATVVCDMGDVPQGVEATAIVTATVNAATPEGADLTNRALFTISSPDGITTNNTVSVDTEVLTEADLVVDKIGPATATAGETISYTVVLTNSGPSTARDVDVKELLPAGLTYVGGSSSQGACVSSICQLGDVALNGVVTMTITATVGSDVTGPVVNTAQAFQDTSDPNPANNINPATTTINALTALQISKVDLTDPVHVGNVYLYEIVVTNTGLSDAAGVVFTDSLPSQVSFEGASPGCELVGSNVICTIGHLPASESRDFR